MLSQDRKPVALLLGVFAVFIWSGIQPRDRFTWFLEVLPAIVGVGLLLATYRRFPFTPIIYPLVAMHAVILIVGGHYTYAEVPLGFWMRDLFHFTRNHYDRIGHFAQGFVPALITRELLLRTSPLRRGRWLTVIVIATCLAISALYELTEWWVAEATGEAAQAFLGTQGDPWDTQWDMFMALLGAISSLLLLSRWQDRQLARMGF